MNLISIFPTLILTDLKLSNGTSITYGSYSLGYAILVDGEFEGNVLSKSPDWTIDEQTGNLKDSRRCWRIGPGRTLERTTNQCPNDFFVFLKEQIEKLPQNGLHPSLIYGFEAEAERLFPKISEEAKAQFKSFISTLKATHKIKEKEERSKVLANFVDDVGPTLLVVVDQKPVVLP